MASNSTNNAAATNTTTNTYKDLWTFDLNDTGDIQHKLRVVRKIIASITSPSPGSISFLNSENIGQWLTVFSSNRTLA